jgi:hypothetical protein
MDAVREAIRGAVNDTDGNGASHALDGGLFPDFGQELV